MRHSSDNQYQKLDVAPSFQTLQKQMTDFIRDPEHCPYNTSREADTSLVIETRRLNVYRSLFFSNLSGFFAGIFPKVKACLGHEAWQNIINAYLREHKAHTPLFHELGQEFLMFLQTQDLHEQPYPPFLLDLAHYEWLELAIVIQPKEPLYFAKAITENSCIRLAHTAWPVQYEWPVHLWNEDEASASNIVEEPSYLLGYRTQDYTTHWMTLTPSMYVLISAFEDNQDKTVLQIVKEVAAQMGVEVSIVQEHAITTLNSTLSEDLWVPA